MYITSYGVFLLIKIVKLAGVKIPTTHTHNGYGINKKCLFTILQLSAIHRHQREARTDSFSTLNAISCQKAVNNLPNEQLTGWNVRAGPCVVSQLTPSKNNL